MGTTPTAHPTPDFSPFSSPDSEKQPREKQSQRWCQSKGPTPVRISFIDATAICTGFTSAIAICACEIAVKAAGRAGDESALTHGVLITASIISFLQLPYYLLRRMRRTPVWMAKFESGWAFLTILIYAFAVALSMPLAWKMPSSDQSRLETRADGSSLRNRVEMKIIAVFAWCGLVSGTVLFISAIYRSAGFLSRSPGDQTGDDSIFINRDPFQIPEKSPRRNTHHSQTLQRSASNEQLPSQTPHNKRPFTIGSTSASLFKGHSANTCPPSTPLPTPSNLLPIRASLNSLRSHRTASATFNTNGILCREASLHSPHLHARTTKSSIAFVEPAERPRPRSQPGSLSRPRSSRTPSAPRIPPLPKLPPLPPLPVEYAACITETEKSRGNDDDDRGPKTTLTASELQASLVLKEREIAETKELLRRASLARRMGGPPPAAAFSSSSLSSSLSSAAPSSSSSSTAHASSSSSSSSRSRSKSGPQSTRGIGLGVGLGLGRGRTQQPIQPHVHDGGGGGGRHAHARSQTAAMAAMQKTPSAASLASSVYTNNSTASNGSSDSNGSAMTHSSSFCYSSSSSSSSLGRPRTSRSASRSTSTSTSSSSGTSILRLGSSNSLDGGGSGSGSGWNFHDGCRSMRSARSARRSEHESGGVAGGSIGGGGKFFGSGRSRAGGSSLRERSRLSIISSADGEDDGCGDCGDRGDRDERAGYGREAGVVGGGDGR